MNKAKRKKYCKSCKFHHVLGINDGKHDDWCCKLSKPSPKAIGECINKKVRELKDE